MANRKVSMRSLKNMFHLRFEKGMSQRDLARSCGMSPGSVNRFLKAFEQRNLSWPLPEDWSEESLLERLGFEQKEKAQPLRNLPDPASLHQQLRLKGMTLILLWKEYKEQVPDGYGYTQFCQHYNRWRKKIDPVMRQRHAPGEKMFVDWAGQQVKIHDRATGEVSLASIFVACLGMSSYTFAEAFVDEKLPSWIQGHVDAYDFFEGVPSATVPDNPKTAVIRACRYEPKLHRSYEEMAEHYGTVLLPARPYKPRDKAKVESAVQVVERWILARLRKHKFFSVAALNDTIQVLLEELNARPFSQMEGCRKALYVKEEKAVLNPLPSAPYRLASWQKAKVNIDYHVTVKKHHYSVPYAYIHREVDVRLSEHTVEIFEKAKRIAAHRRGYRPGGFTTLDAHRPKSHRAHLEWTPKRMIHWGLSIGEATGQVVQSILESRRHPEQGYRSCLGIIRLAKAFGDQRVEAASRRALHYQTCTYQSIKSILESGLDKEEESENTPPLTPQHSNLRPPTYYL